MKKYLIDEHHLTCLKAAILLLSEKTSDETRKMAVNTLEFVVSANERSRDVFEAAWGSTGVLREGR